MTDVNKTNVAAEVLRDMVDEARIVYNWQQIEKKRHHTASAILQPRRLMAFAASVILGAVVIAVYMSIVNNVDKPVPLSFELAEATQMLAVPSQATAERRIPLSDGSMITLAPGASLEVRHNTASLFRTTLHQGWVRYNVIPGHQRIWEIDAGLCRVVVKGTQFTVNRTPDRVDVTVHRGAVAILAGDGDTMLATLTRGKRYTIGSRKHRPESDLADNSKTNKPAPEKLSDVLSDKDTTTKIIRATDRQPARGERRKRASGAAAAGSLVGLGGSDDVNALLTKVDAARARNQHQNAVRLLSRIIREYPEDPAIGLVALTLGKIQLDTLNQPQKAAVAFKRATVSAGLPSPLKEQAFARGVEAYYRAGNNGAAQKMGVTYRRRYPNGSWNTFIERWTRP